MKTKKKLWIELELVFGFRSQLSWIPKVLLGAWLSCGTRQCSCRLTQAEIFLEVYLLEDVEFRVIVKAVWNDPDLVQGELVGNVKTVSEELAKWSKKKYCNAIHPIESLKQQLVDLINRTTGESNQGAKQEITKQIEKLRRQEDMYRGLRSRINCLKY